MTHTLGIFCNEFLDWLSIDNQFKNLREQACLSREDLAGLLNISKHSIRRYEDENKAPHWYFLLLRLINGDLSFYGARWDNVTIQLHDRKLKAPELSNPLYPVEFNAMYNRPAHALRKELEALELENRRLKRERDALERLTDDLQARITLLETESARLKAEQAGIKKGAVIPLFNRGC